MSAGAIYVRQPGDRSVRITSATTTVVKVGTGVLRRIVIGSTFSGTITVNDALGTKLLLRAAMPVGSYGLDLLCSGKVEIVTGGTPGELEAIYQ